MTFKSCAQTLATESFCMACVSPAISSGHFIKVGSNWKMTSGDAAETQFFLNRLRRTPAAVWALGPFGLMKQTGDGTQWRKLPNPLANDGAEGK